MGGIRSHDGRLPRPRVGRARARQPRGVEKLILDGFQAGLSWRTIMHKRDAFRLAFARFEPERVARFDVADVARLLADPGIVRSRAKIEAAISNARQPRYGRIRRGLLGVRVGLR